MNAPAAKKIKTPLSYAWPKMDLGLLIIAAMTIYMAIRSRRFIPIAGFVACPIVALLVDHTVRVIAATAQAARTGKLEVPAIPAACAPSLSRSPAAAWSWLFGVVPGA